MAKRKVTYYPYTKQEIERFKQETSPDADKQVELTNSVLIALRRNYLNTVQANARLRSTVSHFAKVTKSKPINELVKLLKHYLKNL